MAPRQRSLRRTAAARSRPRRAPAAPAGARTSSRPCACRRPRAPPVRSRACAGRGLICVHSACGSGFLASAARGAIVPGYRRGFFLLDASLLRDARAPSVRRAPRAGRFYCPMAFFRFVHNKAAARAAGRRRRVSWRLEDRFERLVHVPGPKRRRLSIALSGAKTSLCLGSDPRFSLLQALTGRSKGGGEA